MWQLEWGHQVDFLATLQKQTGQEPEALKNKPTLSKWTIEYWNAWNLLRSSRQIHDGGIGLIPLSEIKVYFDTFEIEDMDDRERWIRMITTLDTEYADHINSKLNQQRETMRAKAKVKRG